MDVPLNPPTPLRELTPDLKEAAKKRVEANLAYTIKTLSNTVFYKESSVLNSLRDALGSTGLATTPNLSDRDEQCLEKFYACVPLTSYDDYFPYVSRFFKTPCSILDVQDLLSPGLPIFIAHSSGTSGAAPKYFLKYPHPQFTKSSVVPDVPMCRFSSLCLTSVIELVDADGDVAENIPVSIVSAVRNRYLLGLGAKDDDKIVDQKPKAITTPFAVWLIPSYISNIYLTMFFTLMDSSINFLRVQYSTLLHDAVRVMEQNWNVMLDAIETGCLPDVPDLGEYRTHLEAYVKPNSARAAELRNIEVGAEGWLQKVWPSLTDVRAILSGQYANLLPQLRHHFGPLINFRSVRYGATECVVGLGYDASDHNLYRLVDDEHIEFLDIEQERSPANLSQPWEVKTGKKYEVIVTTTHGLWRYALGDIVEVAGFSPTDGQPLIRYCGRKGVGFRVAGEFVLDSLLQEIMASLADTLGPVLEFTTEIDDRKFVRAYGFFVELAGEMGPNPLLALAKIKQRLLVNEGYKKYTDVGGIGNPTVRIVAPGTFKAYREWKIQRTGCASGQMKVPTTTMDIETKKWLLNRVVVEVGAQGDVS